MNFYISIDKYDETQSEIKFSEISQIYILPSGSGSVVSFLANC